MKASTHTTARREIEELAHDGGDLTRLWRGTQRVLDRCVPHHSGACFYTLDPASLLITSHFNAEMPMIPREWLAMEYEQSDVNQLVDVARSPSGWSTLHQATAGDPSSSPRWQANRELGGDQEFITALRTTAGEVWGAIGLYREYGEPMFSDDEIAFVRELAPTLAEGVRLGLLVGEAVDPERPDAPGLLILNSRGEVESMTAATAHWIRAFPDGDFDRNELPASIRAVAAHVAEGQTAKAPAAVSRVRTHDGDWVVLHGARLTGAMDDQIAVVIEPALPARIVPLLMSAYGLTDREQVVTRMVLRGESTTKIAQDLYVSPYTVQEHLKGIFEKTGVRSRRDLVSKVFFSHYEPRVRDNEARVPAGLTIRGGPASAADSPAPGAIPAPAQRSTYPSRT